MSEKTIKLSDEEKITLTEEEKVKLDPKNIKLDDSEKVVAEKKESANKKPALGLFGNMFDVNNDGVIDEKEHEQEKEFLKKITE